MASQFDGVDEDDPCALCKRFQRIYDRLLGGEMVVEVRFGPDVKRWQQADRAALLARIGELKTACAETLGLGRRRFAKRMRFTPY